MKYEQLRSVLLTLYYAAIIPVRLLALLEAYSAANTLRGLLLFNRAYLWLMGIRFGAGTKLSFIGFSLYQRGHLVVGDRCTFGEGTCIWNYEDVCIGDDFLGAPNLTILTGGHDPVTLENLKKPVRIGRRVWCGANVTILPGVTIGDSAVIGAGSLVTKDIPSGAICAGVPSRVIRMKSSVS